MFLEFDTDDVIKDILWEVPAKKSIIDFQKKLKASLKEITVKCELHDQQKVYMFTKHLFHVRIAKLSHEGPSRSC